MLEIYTQPTVPHPTSPRSPPSMRTPPGTSMSAMLRAVMTLPYALTGIGEIYT